MGVAPIVPMSANQPFLESLQKVLAKNYRKQPFGIAQMAAQMGISERHLQRRVSLLIGHGPAQYLRDYRLRMSIGYLNGNRQIGDVAHAVGFTSHAYFTRCFKDKFGTTPSCFRQRFDGSGA